MIGNPNQYGIMVLFPNSVLRRVHRWQTTPFRGRWTIKSRRPIELGEQDHYTILVRVANHTFQTYLVLFVYRLLYYLVAIL